MFIDLFMSPSRQSTTEGETASFISVFLATKSVPIKGNGINICGANNDRSTNTGWSDSESSRCWETLRKGNELEIGVLTRQLPTLPSTDNVLTSDIVWAESTSKWPRGAMNYSDKSLP